jgi:hypothetical protein
MMKKMIVVMVTVSLMSCKSTNNCIVKRSDIAVQKKDTLYVLNKSVGPTLVTMWNEKKWGDTVNAKLVDSVTFVKMMKRVTPVK